MSKSLFGEDIIVEKPAETLRSRLGIDPIRFALPYPGFTKYGWVYHNDKTGESNVMGYYYEPIDGGNCKNIPLTFLDEQDAIQYRDNIIDLANKYAERLKNHKDPGKYLEEIKEELEKITSTKNSVILEMILDKAYPEEGAELNQMGFYNIRFVIYRAM